MAHFNNKPKGFLIPDWFQEQPVTDQLMNVASIFLGLCLGSAIYSGSKATRQSLLIFKRTGTFTPYIIMIWLHWVANLALAFVNWFYMWGSIIPSFWLWFGILLIWVVQTQFIVQIIINRISLLMVVRSHAKRLKWSIAALMTVINISVFCVWIPARMQISPTYVHINAIWDRVEKSIFLCVDLGLNGYFIYLVRSRLISNGLTKYHRLFQMNVLMVIASVSLDVVFIGLMSLPNALVYLNFQSFAYMCKLHIEMNMAELIRKIVRETNHANPDRTPSSDGWGYGKKSSAGKTQNTFLNTITGGATASRYHAGSRAHVELGSRGDSSDNYGKEQGLELGGIHRTIVTEVVHSNVEEDEVSSQSSSQCKLKQGSSEWS
ncbi:hypothetical protein F4780DRAFT_772962 [Xylariomycetidae sp. FL0641]|nr:hypothetical protein F4780DRAFT_772962 [Xylariomycetidae sp. FL0641]